MSLNLLFTVSYGNIRGDNSKSKKVIFKKPGVDKPNLDEHFGFPDQKAGNGPKLAVPFPAYYFPMSKVFI